ncbi:NUDIX domain protein [Jannaschia seosinensis]|uniref:NUDIX domain protein n=1 Tax=Jannaschia seosinensis TaxID=313367 RepID=A0A0M7BG83_9RHOB|nr:NUDIX hydrolase [Jannaschia seosinensis]CUH40346.1 NUDIX domain protein [Jannaschia seosinensis]
MKLKVREQIAALPLRWGDDDKVEVLMVTSRDTGRWVVPKGWTMKGIKPWAAAAIEAMEEAGVKGHIARQSFGSYSYDKRLDDGTRQPCIVHVYPMVVEREKDDWKERKERRRKWFPLRKAANLVAEPELSELLMSLSVKPKKAPVAGAMLRAAAS